MNIRNFQHLLLWLGFYLALLVASCWGAWHLYAKADFGYTGWYSLLGIDQHIEQYAPLNHNKNDFVETSREQHLQLFKEIVSSIHHRGHGLADIRYTTHQGVSETLLTPAEVIHLQDVANLIDRLNIAGWLSLIIGALLAITILKVNAPPPPAKRILLSFGILVLATVVSILLLGPVKVFYWLHIQIFPAEHQWFFFYQDSLMTTLMKAPDLFGAIAIVIGVISVLLWIIVSLMLKRSLLILKAKAEPDTAN